ncbi:MAG: M3 family metallopeptidase [Akkermansia sp.]|nr:M3 family metallopeptidase [Akkermansia sp.]
MNETPFLNSEILVEWSKLTPNRARKEIREAIEEAKATVANICAVTEPTYENSFAALESSGSALTRGWTRLHHLGSVMDSQELRDVINELMPEVVIYSSSVTLNPQLYAVLKKAAEMPWVAELSEVKQRFIHETLQDFRENGADLTDEQKIRFTEISTKLAQLSHSFGEHVLDSTNAWEYVTADKSELAGLPDSACENARHDALAKGYGTEENPQWRFTLQFTSVQPVLTFADNEQLRRRIWNALNDKCTGKYDTTDFIHEILALREEKATMLGYATYSDYVTARRMAGSGNTALEFINNLHSRVAPAFRAEQEEIRRFAEELTGTAIPVMQPWDVSYYSEKRRKALYDFDSEELRPYFPMDGVLQGMFSIYAGLYGIRFKQRQTACIRDGEQLPPEAVEVWHPEVLFYEVYDEESGEHLGSFYADWYPRDTKRAGAWMNCLSGGLPPMNGSPRRPHLALMCGNMSKPIGDKPALLTHYEVQTVFHEFGHLLHQILSNVEVESLSGCNVAWDFVELPSQINENWTWESEALDRFARHWQTGESIPKELKAKMLAARNYGAASFFMRQLSFGKIDLELHTNTQLYKGRDIEEVDREILANYRIPLTVQGNSCLRCFSHIFNGGYESGYYSYKWAEMLEADAFSRFAKEGIFNPATGRDFRRCILSRGNSRPAAELYRDFMQRDPDPAALLSRSGIQ